jgi:hypothetical protein
VRSSSAATGFGLKGADITEHLLGGQWGRTMRERKVRRLAKAVQDADITEMSH